MKIDQLTFTRFIAAIAIVFFHFGKTIYPFNNNSISFVFEKANLGVSYFFILSGFVMIIAYQNKQKIYVLDYLKNRFARIYPIYLFALLLLVLLYFSTNKTINYKSFLYNITMLQAWRPGRATSLNFPGWSLSVELFFYVLFPVLFNRFYKKFSFKNNAFWIIALFITSQIVLHILLYSSFYEGYPSRSHDFIFYFPLMHLNEFLLGNLAGLYFLKFIKPKKYDWQIITLLVILLLALKFKTGINYHNGMLALIFVPIIILISANKSKITELFKHKTLIFLGEISFGIYILQVPIFKFSFLILNYIGIKKPIVLFSLSLIFLIIISSLSFIYIESPLRKKIRNLKLN